MDHEIRAQGAALLHPHGVRYTLWAPAAPAVEAVIYTDGGVVARTVPLRKEEEGFWRGTDPLGRAGDLFKIRQGSGEPLPPPAARYLPQGVQGPAQVMPLGAYAWRDAAWRRPPFRDLVFYELHLGTFTPEGTYGAVIARMPYLRDLGVNAIEIMPVADFPGQRGWGYDGVQMYAPARCYGTPDDFRALVDAAHAHGLAVVLDVVYNHLGPDGNYLPQFSPHYFSSAEKTPWGDAINFGHGQSAPVREFYLGNLMYWMDEFHIDGFRLDATHAIADPSERHIMREFAEMVERRGGYIVAEDERNEVQIIKAAQHGGFGFDAVWADDFHHTVEVATIEASVYRQDFTGELTELARVLEQGWYYSGQPTRKRGLPRGTPADGLGPEHFIFCISNHDQVGNRALGERLHHLVKPATYRAASALLLLTPYTPLLFMGQEWGASTPFQYFTDHHDELGVLVEKGRKDEFSEAFAHHAGLEKAFPSPQAEETFQHSKLRWEELTERPHAGILALYRELLALRREHPEFRPRERSSVQFAALPAGVLAMRVQSPGGDWLALCDLQGGHGGALGDAEITRRPEGARWQPRFSTSEARFNGSGHASFQADPADTFHFPEPELLLLRADTSGA